MAAYIIYLIDPDGRVRRGESMDCRDDAEALDRLARVDRGNAAAELWQGGRLVVEISIDGGVSKGPTA